MKRGTSNHPKVADFARRLGVPMPHALGILQYLWDFTEDYAPRGDVGRFSDETISENCRWNGDAEALIGALIGARWLDKPKKSNGVRLGVHDWWDHCEDTVHRKLARAHEFFWDGKSPKLARLGKDERTEAETWYAQHAHGVRTPRRARNVRTESAQNAPLPSLAKPIPTPQPSAHTAPCAQPEGERVIVSNGKRPPFWDERYSGFCEKYRKHAAPGGLELADEDFSGPTYEAWGLAGFDGQEKIIAAMDERIAAGVDPRYWTKPLKFIQSDWKRKYRKHAGDTTDRYREIVPVALQPWSDPDAA